MTPAVAVLLLGIYFAASTGVACLFCRWARKRIAAQHDTEDDWQPTDNELADVLAIWADDFNTACQHIDDIDQQREEGQQ